MAKKLSPLTQQVTLDLSKYTAGIKQLARDQQALEKALRPIADRAKQIGTVFTATGLAVGGAMLAMAKKAADYGDAMLEASQKTGIGTKQLSALKLIAEQSGSSFDGITAGVSKLSKGMFEAATKGGEAAKTFQALGITIKDSTGHVRQASDILPEIAERFSKMRDGTEKTALAMRLFGKAGADMIPFLNQGADGIRRATELTEKYSISLTEAEAKLGDEFNDTLAESKLAMQGLAQQIGNALLPSMTKMVAAGNNVIAMMSRWAKEHPGLTRAIALTAGVLTGSGGLLLGMSLFATMAPKMITNLRLLSAGFMSLSVPMRLVLGAIAALTAVFIAFPKARGPILDFLAAMYKGLVVVYNSIYNIGQLLGSAVTGQWMQFFQQLKTSNSRISAEVQKAEKDFRAFTDSVGKGIKDMNAAASVTPPDIKVPGLDLGDFEKDAKDVKDRTKQLVDSMNEALRPADALGAELAELQKQFSDSQIIAIYGDRILDAAQAQRAHGFAVAANVLELIKQMNAMEELTFLQDRVAARWAAIAEEMDKEREAFRKMVPDIFGGEIPIVRDAGKQAQIDELERRGRLITGLQKQQDEVRQLAEDMIRLRNAGLSTAQIEAMLGARMEEVLERAKQLGVGLDSVTRKTLDQAARAETLRKSWGETFARISDSLVDMIVDFDFNLRRLKEIGLDTARSLARSFLDGFFKPFKEGLQELGRQAGDWAAKLLFGVQSGSNQKQGSSGLIGGLLGNAGGLLSGLFGKNKQGGSTGGIFGSAIPGMESIGPALAGPGGATGSAAAGAGVSAAMGWATLGASLVGPIAGAINKIGAGRDSANEIIKSQNAFVNETLKSILGDTGLSATNKLKQVQNVWASMEANLARFSAAGGEGGVTANQAFASLSPLVSQIQSDLIKQGARADGEESGGIHVENIYIQLRDVVTPEQLNTWLKLDAAGFRTEIIKAVDLADGLVTAH